MELNETMVENIDNSEADDTPVEEIVEEEQDESEDLSSVTGEEEEPAEEEPEQPKATEPGWIKKRVEKAVTKAIAETEARMQAMFEERMAPIRERMIEDEAKELVRSGEVKSLETAKELVRLRNGQPVAAQQEQPRQANGQFVSKDDVAVKAQLKMLNHQADRIMESGGPDVREEFLNNEEVKEKVRSGEWDFYDVADYLKKKPSKKKPPSPMRSPNGASGSKPNAIESMTDEQFARLEKRIKEGARYTLR